MNKRLVWVLLAALGLLIGTIASLHVSNAQEQRQVCEYDFEVGVLQGPDAGTRINGKLRLEIGKDGVLTGVLTSNKGDQIAVNGEVSHHALNMAFELEKATAEKPRRYLFGSGASWTNIIGDTSCGTALGGTFSSPKPGNIGYWEGGFPPPGRSAAK